MTHDSGRPLIGVFILAYNVERQIEGVLTSIPRDVYERLSCILVIDNQSRDDTVAVASRALRKHQLSKVKILRNCRNYGYGGSHKVAFHHLKALGMDYALLLHGDGQGDPEALRQLIQGCDENNFDFVIGSRFLDPALLDRKYSRLRVWGNQALILLQQGLSGTRVTDPGSGEMAYRLGYLDDMPYFGLTDLFHFTPQLLLCATRRGFRFREFPLRWKETEVSSVNIWAHGWQMLKMLLGYRFRGLPVDTKKSPADYPTEVL